MAPQQPTSSASSANGGRVVTVTVFSTASSSPSNLPAPSEGGGGVGVPIGAIVGGVAGGVTLAVIMVLIWKYWGLVIKRTEKRRRKEVQDILTMRENTRRNAMTRFKPQSLRRPALDVNPDGPRVKFLTRKPTWPRGKKNNSNASNSNSASPAPAAIPPTLPTDEMRVVDREAPTGESGTDETQQPSPSFGSAGAPLFEHGSRTEQEQKSESAEQLLEEVATSSPPGIAPSPGSSRSPSGRSHSPTPSRATSSHTSSPRPSRSIRMRMPTRLPDPPAAPPIPIRMARAHQTRRSSASTPSGLRNSFTPPRSPTAESHHRAPETPGTPPRSTSPVADPAVSPAPVAGPSTAPSPPPSPPPISLSALTFSNSPLRHSVLPCDRPVVMPRPKNASPTSPSGSRPPSPASTWGDAPTIPSWASIVSAGSREPSVRHEYPDSPSHENPPTEMAGEKARQGSMSSQSAYSAYSNDRGD